MLSKLSKIRQAAGPDSHIEKGIDIVRPVFSPFAKVILNAFPQPNTSCESFEKLIKDRTIALVGNSSSLNNSGYGPEIDSHDLVIRMNTGVIPESLNSNDTGMRTDIWGSGAASTLVHPEVRKVLDERHSDLLAVLVNLPHVASSNVTGISQLKFLMKFFREKGVYYLEKSFFDELVDKLGGKKPSTGFGIFSTILDTGGFKSLDLYGFTFDTSHRIIEPSKFGDIHDFEKEKDIVFQTQRNDNRIKLRI